MPVETQVHKPLKKITRATYSRSELKAAMRHCRERILKGSKSFSLSAHIFNQQKREAAFAIYAWCRYCDDQIDDSDFGFRSSDVEFKRKSKAEARNPKLSPTERLEDLKKKTRAVYQGKRMTHPTFIAFQHITHKYKIPMEYPMELLAGMNMDIQQQRYETISDLSLYCYRVAGTVGLMMTHVMGVNNEMALLHAANLGKAMQLTNIARDVMEDADMNRIYLPLDWLQEFKVDPDNIKDPQFRPAVTKVVGRLLTVADIYYQSGDRGLRYLPLRAAFTIASARNVYADIGKQVKNLGEKAWDKRTIVPFQKKLWVMILGLGKVMRLVPKRLVKRWHRVPIKSVWKNI